MFEFNSKEELLFSISELREAAIKLAIKEGENFSRLQLYNYMRQADKVQNYIAKKWF